MPVILPKEIEDLPLIVSVSGGKDSTAVILALREANIRVAHYVFADTGWEAPETMQYLDLLRERLGIAIDVVGTPGGMPAKIRERLGFPAGKQRWCTRKLKLEPLRAYHDAIGDDTVNVVGVRSQESEARAALPVLEDEDGPRSWGGWVWRPLIDWTVEDVLLIHHRHGVPVNPMYQKGHDRVGCYPCIFAQKGEIELLATEAPWRIDEIRALETEVTAEREQRGDAITEATFFRSRIGAARIDDVVAWSRTERGGRQLPLLQEPPKGGCMKWGLCDTGSK